MLAYAAGRPVAGGRKSSPHALLLVISAHVALVAVVMSAKMELPPGFHPDSTEVTFVPAPTPPKSDPTPPHPSPPPGMTINTTTLVPLPPIDSPPVDTGPVFDPGPIAGGGANVMSIIPKPDITPVRHGPQLLTPPSQLKPPYPASKLLGEEEATLTLRLSIDDHGRVVAVDPVGRADREFLEAARRHLLAHWRYQPATDDGRAVASSLTVTLRFMLDG